MTCPREHRLDFRDPHLALARLVFVGAVLAVLVLHRLGWLR